MKKIFYLPIVAFVAGLLLCTACKKEVGTEIPDEQEGVENPTNIVYNDTIIDITDQIPCKIKMPDSAFLVNSNIFHITQTPDSVLLINNQSQLQQFCDNQSITNDLTHYSMLVFSGTSNCSFYDITPTLTYNNDKKKYELIIYIKHGIVMLTAEVKWKRYYLISPKINSINDIDIIINDDSQPGPEPEPNIATILLGSWQEDEQTSFVYTDNSVRDTITFSSDGLVYETAGIFDHYEYQLLDDTTIIFSSYRDYDNNPRFSIPINICVYYDSNKYKIIFYNFISRSTTQDIKNITYTKIQ